MSRTASCKRTTAETSICLELNLDGTGKNEITTGVGFFDHMLTLLAKHSLIDLKVEAKGDLEVDSHHTVEDVGIVLGQCFLQALGNKAQIQRYGSAYLPMDETLARVALDISGRGFLVFRGSPEPAPLITATFPFTLVEEFFRAFAHNAQITLHTELLYGRDAHHQAEALFKGLGRALRQALTTESRESGIPSTKGSL